MAEPSWLMNRKIYNTSPHTDEYDSVNESAEDEIPRYWRRKKYPRFDNGLIIRRYALSVKIT